MIALMIDGLSVEIDGEQSILEAASRAGIEIPALCWHPEMTGAGSCRLCVVDVQGEPHPVAACVAPARAGMIVRTETPALIDLRRTLLTMLLADYDDAGHQGAPHAETEFERWCRHYRAERPTWSEVRSRAPVDGDSNPFIRVDMNQCILCTRCVRACADIQGRFVLGVGGRGHEAKIIAGLDSQLLDARCESCGACVTSCPTRALDDRMAFGTGVPDERVTTTCSYCGVGCQLDLHVKNGQIVRATSVGEGSTPFDLTLRSQASEAAPPLNGMSLCVKGRYGYDFVHHPERLTTPRIRQYLLGDTEQTRNGGRGDWVPVDWDRALDVVADKLHGFWSESGGDAIGLFSSAKCSNEENYLMQKLARQVVGTNNIDHCARLCHASTVAGLAMSLGSGAMSNSMDDIVENAEALFIIGSNTTEQHPVFGAMIRQAVLTRGVKLLVADPRRVEITEFATSHIRHRPGSDVALLNGLMHVILENGWEDRAFIASRCEGFEELAKGLRKYDPVTVAKITGVGVEELYAAAELLATHKPMAVIWAMGITQHTTGVMNVLALANLQMLLGNLGLPGGGVNPLRGQNNVQGACDMGALPNVFSGYQSVGEENARARFHAAWELTSLDEASRPGSWELPSRPGATVTEMIEAASTGAIRGLYLLGENPAMTDPDSNHVRDCLARAEFVVLQEIFPSETSHYADVLLPGTSFAERDGTFTNTERRIQRFRHAIDPLGEARPDWQIIADLARRILRRQGRRTVGEDAGWEYSSTTEILQEIARLTPSYAGVSSERLGRGERLQWPVLGPEHPGTPILHVDGFPRGRGRFHVVDHLPPHEPPDADYPLLLTTGRVLYHWHGGEMTRRARGLSEIVDQPLVEIAPEDAARWEINDGTPIVLASRRGEMRGIAAVTQRVAEGVVFANFHFPGAGNVNNLTISALDPVAKIPEYKVCAVRVEACRAD